MIDALGDAILLDVGNDIKGGPGDDTIMAGNGPDDIRGGPGDDFIEAMAGDDEVFGDSGDDTIFGGAVGQLGLDILHGGKGDDLIYGGSDKQGTGGGGKNLYIYGDEGHDELWGK